MKRIQQKTETNPLSVIVDVIEKDMVIYYFIFLKGIIFIILLV